MTILKIKVIYWYFNIFILKQVSIYCVKCV